MNRDPAAAPTTHIGPGTTPGPSPVDQAGKPDVPGWNARSNSTRRTYRNLSFDQLRALLLDGELTESDWVQKESTTAWTEIGAVPALADAVPAFSFRRDRGIGVAEAEEDMDMTPMIDVVFQLLLFFLLISTFQVQKAIGFPSPGDDKESKNIPTIGQLGRDRVLVSVNAENQIELLHYDQQGKLTQREPVKKEELVDRLGEIGKRDRKTSVVIQADDKALHESVVGVIDAAYQANMEDVRIAQPVEAKGEKPAETPVAPKAGGPARKIEDK
jgi:biopolymer transport protein ExbD